MPTGAWPVVNSTGAASVPSPLFRQTSSLASSSNHAANGGKGVPVAVPIEVGQRNLAHGPVLGQRVVNRRQVGAVPAVLQDGDARAAEEALSDQHVQVAVAVQVPGGERARNEALRKAPVTKARQGASGQRAS